MSKIDHKSYFQEKFSAKKLVKIAENYDNSIDPSSVHRFELVPPMLKYK
jgi:hypothetical protein